MTAPPTSTTSGRTCAQSLSPQARPGPGRCGLRPGIPFVAVHLACIAVVLVGVSPVALAVAAATYVVRAFGITAFYHRCFSHKAFRVSRPVQLAGAVLGAAAAQRGPLWWVGHHRAHHRYTDRPGDPHSPRNDGMLGAHLLWLFDTTNQPTRMENVDDLARFPEMRVLDRYHHVVPVATAAGLFALGTGFEHLWPGLHTSGWQLVVWGFAISTVALYHSTFAVNSVAHRFGRRRFATRDDSRNNWLVSLLTLGEGWHNNHHRFPNTARQGLSRLEIDPTWLGIRLLAAVHLAHDLRPVPPWAMATARGAGATLAGQHPRVRTQPGVGP